MAHFLLRYTLAHDYLVRRAALRDAHLAMAWAASDKGDLILGGAIGDPVEGALLLFTDADAARAFAVADPYVTNGLVVRWDIVPWATVAGEQAATPVYPAD